MATALDWLKLCAIPDAKMWAHESTPLEDVDLLFGPYDDNERPVIFGDNMKSLAHIMAASGCFRSVSEARRNGWGREIEHGFQGYKVGKRAVFVFKNCNQTVGSSS